MNVARKNTFVPHADLSSQVDLDVELGIITKTRAKRSVGNLLNEARALRVWENLLDQFNISAPTLPQVTSPRLVSVVPDTRALNMTFCTGVTIGRAVVRDYDFREKSLGLNEVRHDIALRVGALAGLKSAEGLIHGDYQQRHLLYDPVLTQTVPPHARLSVIDVESSRLTAIPKKVADENESLHQWLMTTAPKRQAGSIEEAYQDGFSTGRAHAPRTAADIVREVRKEFE